MTNEKTYVPGVLFKEFETKFGMAVNISFTSEFLDFLMSRIGSSPRGINTTFYRKKNSTEHTTHYGILNEGNTYTSGVQETFSKESTDKTKEIDPYIDMDSPF